MNLEKEIILERILERMKQKVYLGDGLYAAFDGYQIILSAQRDDITHWIGLEPETQYLLDQYKKQLNELITQYKALENEYGNQIK